MSTKLPRTLSITPYYHFLLRTPPPETLEEIRERVDAIPTRDLPSRWRDRHHFKEEIVREWKHTDHPDCPVEVRTSTINDARVGIFSKKTFYSGYSILCEPCKELGIENPLCEGMCVCPLAFPRDLSRAQKEKLTPKTKITYGGETMKPYYYVTTRNMFKAKSKERPRTIYSVMGGILAFCNHCCTPNIAVHEVKTDKGWVWMAVALKKIKKGEELFWNYGKEYWENEEKCCNMLCCGL